ELSAAGEKADKDEKQCSNRSAQSSAAQFVAEFIAAEFGVEAAQRIHEWKNQRQQEKRVEVKVSERAFGDRRVGDVCSRKGQGENASHLHTQKINRDADQALEPSGYWRWHCAPMRRDVFVKRVYAAQVKRSLHRDKKCVAPRMAFSNPRENKK